MSRHEIADSVSGPATELYPELTFRPLRHKQQIVETLVDIAQRHRDGCSEPGDWVKAARLMIALSKREIISLVFDLSMPDDFSFYPYILKLSRRPLTEVEQARKREAKRQMRDQQKQRIQEETVAKVALLQKDTAASVDEAFEVIAQGEPYTSAKVKMDYMKGVGAAREQGFAVLQPPNHMVAGMKVSMDAKSPKGRRPKKG
ncbi:MAG: hypothetical protein RL268_1076 [Pseudomonadota bacterium]